MYLWSVCMFKENQHVSNRFIITDMDNLVSISWSSISKSVSKNIPLDFLGLNPKPSELKNILFLLHICSEVIWKISANFANFSKIIGERPCIYLYVFIDKTLIFFSVLKKKRLYLGHPKILVHNYNKQSFAFSCPLLILLLRRLEWNIQTNGK